MRDVRIEINTLTADLFLQLFASVGWERPSLELISTREAAAFYEKNGFEPCPCAWDGPGMMKMLRK